MNKAEALTHLARQTGLDRSTVKDLMKKGWTYEKKVDQLAAFVAPFPKGQQR